jgi:hypothetical protein
MPIAQAELQIEHERIRRQPMTPLEKATHILHASPARTANDNHFMLFEIAKPQPPIDALFVLLHENKIRTQGVAVYPLL